MIFFKHTRFPLTFTDKIQKRVHDFSMDLHQISMTYRNL